MPQPETCPEPPGTRHSPPGSPERSLTSQPTSSVRPRTRSRQSGRPPQTASGRKLVARSASGSATNLPARSETSSSTISGFATTCAGSPSCADRLSLPAILPLRVTARPAPWATSCAPHRLHSLPVGHRLHSLPVGHRVHALRNDRAVLAGCLVSAMQTVARAARSRYRRKIGLPGRQRGPDGHRCPHSGSVTPEDRPPASPSAAPDDG